MTKQNNNYYTIPSQQECGRIKQEILAARKNTAWAARLNKAAIVPFGISLLSFALRMSGAFPAADTVLGYVGGGGIMLAVALKVASNHFVKRMEVDVSQIEKLMLG